MPEHQQPTWQHVTMGNRECVCGNLSFPDHLCQPGRRPFPTDKETGAWSKEAEDTHWTPEAQTPMGCMPACTWGYPPRSMGSLKAVLTRRISPSGFRRKAGQPLAGLGSALAFILPLGFGPDFLVSGLGILAGLLQGGQQLLGGLEVPRTQRGHQEVGIIEQKDVVVGMLLGHR